MFNIVYGSIFATKAESGVWDRDCMARKGNVCYLPFYLKKIFFATPGIEHRILLNPKLCVLIRLFKVSIKNQCVWLLFW